MTGVQHRALVAFRLPRGTSDADLSASLAAAGYSVEEGDSVRHRDTYLDTQDGRLYCAGLRLRLRRDRDIWQLLEEGLLVAEQPALDEETPRSGVVGDRMASPVGRRKLLPYVELRVSQRVLRLSTPGGAVLEASLQRLSFAAPGRQGWKRGPRVLVGERRGVGGEIERLATVLRHLLRLSPRGDPLCLAAASLDLPLPGAPVPREYLLLPADTLGTAARKILAHQAHKMWANTEGTVADLDPEFLHDLRVASRRARAALRLLVPLYGETGCRQLWDELAWIADVLGAVRDLDVFLARFDSQLARAQASDEALLGTLRARRGAARERLLQALATERYRELVRRLREMELPADAAPEQRAWADRLTVEVAPGLVGRGVKRVRRWRREVGNEPTEEQLHRLRLLLKRLRYVCEFFADVLGEPVARAIPPLVELQDCLGDLQDAVVAAEALGELADGVSPSDPSARQQLLTIGSLIQVQREIAASKRNSFRRLWGKLPRRVRRLRRALRVLGAEAATQKAPARTAAAGDPKPASSTAS